MNFSTLTLWRELQQKDESQPLYRKLWFLHYRRSLWAASSEYSNSMANMMVTMFLSPVFIFAPLAVSPLFGSYWAALVAGMIRYEHQQDRFDVMGTLPGGSHGAYHTIALLHVRRSRLYQHLMDALNVTALVGGICMFLLVSGMLVGIASPTVADRESILSIIFFTIGTGIFLVSLYVDQIQSVILGIRLGMVVPLVTRSTFEARTWAIAGYATAQAILYGVAGVVGFGVVRWLLPHSAAELTLSLLSAALLLFGLREAAVRWLAHYLTQTLGTLSS